MESCLLCLEINKDVMDFIKVNSPQWQELNMAEVIKKHFWPLDTIRTCSWICLSCWQEIDDFHKFYLRIEEAHLHFGKIKVEDEEEETLMKKANIGENTVEVNKDNSTYCFLEPEILIDQPFNLAEAEMLIDQPTDPNLKMDYKSAITEPLDEIELDDMPLKQASKRLRLQKEAASKDPLGKSHKLRVNKSRNVKKSKRKCLAESKSVKNSEESEFKVKAEPADFNENNSESSSDNDNDEIDVNYQPDKDTSVSAQVKRRKVDNKHRTHRKDNDKFIAEHFMNMICDLCQVPFENFPAMHKHFTETHKQRGYVICCKKKYFDRSRLVDHLHYHLNPDHFKCGECGKAMSDRISFDSHMMRVHKTSEHCCDICGKPFTKPYFLRIHKLTHLPEEEKKFPCTDCGKNYGTPYLLKQHIQAVHLKRFAKICYICGKAINSSTEFKIHMNKHEGIPGPVINCDVCGLRLTSDRGLKLHKESQHPVGGKQEHPCNICHKISPTLRALRKHINTMHGKVSEHKCTICEKGFKRPETLREHMATHTGTTLYTCPWCPKTFNSNGNMHAHRKKVHPIEWEASKLKKYSGNLPAECHSES